MNYQKKQMEEAAILYYQKKYTQQEIATLMNLSRQTVSKLLNDAVKENIVEIKIHNAESDCIELERKISEKFNIKNPDKISQCINQEDGSTYNVWEIDYEGKKYILKQTKGLEKEIYEKISPRVGIPEYFGSTILEDKEYLLIEYISGCDLCKCKREQLIKVLDALINIQKRKHSVGRKR